MTINEIIEKLSTFNLKYPLEAMQEAVIKKDEITPLLLDALDYAYAENENLDDEYMLHTFGMYLLAQFKEQRAFEKLLKITTLAEEQIESILGDSITTGYSEILCSTYDGDLDAMKKIIENKDLYFFARGEVLKAVGLLMREEKISKDAHEQYLKELLWKFKDDELIDYVVNQIQEHIFLDLLPDIKEVFKTGNISLEWSSYAGTIDLLFRNKKRQRKNKPVIEDAVASTKWWACFEQETNKDSHSFNMDKLVDEMEPKKKVGRNEPCICGSGKKFKKCCDGKKAPSPIEQYEAELLSFYPQKDDELSDGQVSFYDYFKADAIELDKYVTIAMCNVIPIYQLPYEEKFEVRINNFALAFDLFLEIMEKEQFNTLSEFDDAYQVHHRAIEWLTEFDKIAEGYELVSGTTVKGVLEKYKG